MRTALDWLENHRGCETAMRMGTYANIISSEFMKLRRDDEFLFMDVLMGDREASVSHSFNEQEWEVLDQSIENPLECGGLCWSGAMEIFLHQQCANIKHTMPSLRQIILPLIGKIWYSVDTLAYVCQDYALSEADTIRFMRIVVGHERRHAQQEFEFLFNGREEAINDIRNGAPLTRYTHLASELDADQAGFQFMESFEA